MVLKKIFPNLSSIVYFKVYCRPILYVKNYFSNPNSMWVDNCNHTVKKQIVDLT